MGAAAAALHPVLCLRFIQIDESPSDPQGVVLEIEPLRTKIRDDDGNPVYLSNTEVGQYGVRNLTQVSKLGS